MRPLAFISALIITAATASAQTAPFNNFLIEETTVHNSGVFESAQKDYCAAVVRGGAPACLVFSIATFGHSGQYLTVLPFASFIHYDQGKYTEKGMTPAQAKELSARRGPTVVDNHESAIMLYPDLSILSPQADKPLNLVTEYRLRPGSLSAFLAIVKSTLLPAARKAHAPAFEVFRTTVGESPDRVFILTRLDNFAALDEATKPNPNPAWQQFLAQNVEHVNTIVLRYRADLSTNPMEQAPREQAPH